MANTGPSDPIILPRSARVAEAGVDAEFIRRWSTRSFSPEPLPPDTVRSLFEAARWAPSSSNSQPWLFIYADDVETLRPARALLVEANQRWASKAPLLIFAFARRVHPQTGAPLRTGAFDTGAAWFSLALQAEKLGLHAHAMGGVHHEQTYDAFGVPRAEYESMAAIVVGYPGDPGELPPDLLAREAPSPRKSQDDFAYRGRYGAR
jgi:nitroreductase